MTNKIEQAQAAIAAMDAAEAAGNLRQRHIDDVLIYCPEALRSLRVVGWMRYLNGKPDWAEDCLLAGEPSHDDKDQWPEENGYSYEPIYAAEDQP